MYNNKLSEAINSAVIDCINNGNGKCKVKNNSKIEIVAEWETWEENENYDIVEIYIYENGIIKFSYQDADIKVEQE